jgi:gas vesicle protein
MKVISVMENNNGDIGKRSVGVAFLIGVVAGGVSALLLTPQTGAQMRMRMKRGAHAVQERSKHITHNMQDRAGHMKGAVTEARTAYREEMDKQHASTGTAVLEKSERAL